MRVTNEQLKTALESIDKRVLSIEGILMSRRNPNGNMIVNPTVSLMIRFVVFPLIVVIGAVVGVNLSSLGG